MNHQGEVGRNIPGLTRGFARLRTGAKLFLILSAALLPLAIIALVAARQTSQVADSELRSNLRLAATESARALSIELGGDMTALRVALNALDEDPSDAASCARAQGVFAGQLSRGARFTIIDRDGSVICGVSIPAANLVPLTKKSPAIVARLVPDADLALGIAAASGRLRAVATFPTAALAEIARPSGFTPAFAATLVQGSQRLELDAMPSLGTFDRTETIGIPVSIGGLLFEMTVRAAPISSPMVIAMLLPLLMWAAAASIGWFVVDRLLIGPLRDLRARVARYRPGEEIDLAEARSVPAQEIRELGETFQAISRTVKQHEAGLAEGLVRQTKLTREVHHRVKNNLQVISSLINFHARGARSPDATAAYAAIQRRVDALAVVHRNHFAEQEESRGLGLRSVIGELAANIRATAPDQAALSITLDVDSFLATQDVAIAISFLITEIIELAMTCQPDAHVRLSLKPATEPTKAVLRISSVALIGGDCLTTELSQRYGRVIDGLSRQLRSTLHHDPLAGAYEIAVAVVGLD